MVVSRDPERSVLSVREHRKREESPFAGRHGLNVDRPYSPRIRRRWWRIRRTMPISISRSEERRVGKSVSVRVDLGGRRIIKKKKTCNINTQHRDYSED